MEMEYTEYGKGVEASATAYYGLVIHGPRGSLNPTKFKDFLPPKIGENISKTPAETKRRQRLGLG